MTREMGVNKAVCADTSNSKHLLFYFISKIAFLS